MMMMSGRYIRLLFEEMYTYLFVVYIEMNLLICFVCCSFLNVCENVLGCVCMLSRELFIKMCVLDGECILSAFNYVSGFISSVCVKW